ncbi:MAG: ABC transporter permease subunit [Thermomicrobia bacterium]|nr:ABC transporter permease subunit [Thermomicrobia bacterium]
MRGTRAMRAGTGRRAGTKTPLSARIWRERWMYLFILPGFVYFILFRYLPLLGNIIAFQDYSPFLGFSSPWVGLANFHRLFTDPDVGVALRNTLEISILQLVFFFPAPIMLALLLDSMVSEPVKRLMQSILYLPHFMSWVIIIALWQQIFGGAGFINQSLRNGGHDTINIMTNPAFFKLLVVLELIWKETGWGTIIILAALTRIDVTLYEAAAMDGANGWRRLLHVTLPGIRGVIVLLLILRLATILSTGFEQIFLQRNAVGAQAAEVLDTFTYFRGIQGGDWGFAAAVGLVKGLVAAILVFAANRVAKAFGDEGAF